MCRNGYIDQKVVYSILREHKNEHITIRMLTEIYNNVIEGSKVSKSKMFNYMKNEMKLAYKKPKISHKQTDNNSSIAMRCIFLRRFVKYLMLGYKVLYIDELGFNIVNNKFKTWINHNANREVFMSSKTTNITHLL
jgi:hypothetical protein